MIVISRALVLAGTLAGLEDYPVIGWQNVVTAGNIAATSADVGNPATNLANPATHLRWQSEDDPPVADQYLTVTTGVADPIDYMAIAAHNLGTVQSVVSIEAYIGASWVEIVEETLLADDQPALFRFESQSLSQIRLRMQPGSAAAKVAVLYCGALLTMERRLYEGHTPISLGRKVEVANMMAENGVFLGRVQTRESREGSAKFSLLTPDWVRGSLDPFLRQAKTRTFFVAWRPASFPDEVGYCWLTNDPRPVPEAPSNLMAVEFNLGGVA